MYNEEYLLIDYRALLDIAVLAAFGKSSGLDQLPLHLAEAIMPFQPKKFLVRTDKLILQSNSPHLFQLFQYTFYFYPMNSWYHQFDMILYKAFDAGIRDFWFQQAT